MEEYLWNYIDNIRNIVSSEEEGWVVGSRISTYCKYLGIKDATQNRGLASNNPRPWKRAMIKYQHNELLTCVDEVKWGKYDIMLIV